MPNKIEIESHADHVALAGKGNLLTAEEAEVLEQALTHNPYDSAARFQLLGYYLRLFCQGINVIKLRTLNIIWLIDNFPECRLLSSQYGLLSRELDEDSFAEAKRHWLQKIDLNPTNVDVIGNAAEFFAVPEPELSEELFRKAMTLAPNERLWSRSLAFKLSRSGPARAREAYEAMRFAIDQEPDERLKYHMLDTLADLALQIGLTDEAFDAALKCLTMAFTFGQDEHDGNAIHNSNCTMGRIALKEGDLDTAKRHLAMAGDTPGSPLLALAPNMTLAYELLAAGEGDAVIEYLQACEKFWTLGRDMGLISEWVEEIRQGRMPNMVDFVRADMAV
ncbi:MAG: hypothetical protein KGS72_20535 [Cyanobacteria bacterium REEB67]|nr:hypothetical protein [Cyanobacteria bacterium REEB67]